MSNISRRTFVKGASGVAALGLTGCLSSNNASAAKAKVVVIGGGYGGAIAAKYIRMMDPAIDVTLIEQNEHYYSCPLSNWVIAHFRELDAQKHSYKTMMSAHKVNVVHEKAIGVDHDKKMVKTDKGNSFSYDKLVVSPGVDFKPIEGYTEEASNKMPHAWKAGPQTQALADQLKAMKDGGTVIIRPPNNPFRCPPGPYERASLIAWYLKKHKPKSKVVMFDPKPKFSKFGLFTGGWKELYGYGSENSMIEWNGSTAISAVNAKNMTVTTDVEDIKGDVISIIPDQMAGAIAREAGLADDKGWCPVDFRTFESTLHKGVYVIGDSSAAAGLPKSGYAANSEAKVAAAAIVDELNGRKPGDPTYTNTCYSLLDPDYGISVAAVYKYESGDKVESVSSGLSPGKASAAFRKQEALYNESWYQSIMTDMFG
jgi:sulfide dehydrogenase [flavocytochrome c] flavoprotein subunit